MNRYDWLEGYLQSKKGATQDYKAEWGWHRWLLDGKMFAAACQPGEEHAGFEKRELLTLKCDPAVSELLRAQYPDIVPGFYMDKRNWISVFLDGAVPEDTLRELCDRSYALVRGKLTKKRRMELEEA